MNKSGSTSMVLAKYELENCSLLIRWFCFVQEINFPYLTFINFVFPMKFIIYELRQSFSLSLVRGCFMLCGYKQACKHCIHVCINYRTFTTVSFSKWESVLTATWSQKCACILGGALSKALRNIFMVLKIKSC